MNTKKGEANRAEYTYDSDWINKLEKLDHWKLYWYQQNLMQNYLTKGDRILEIGVGSGFTANYLRSKGFKVTTIDIDDNKNPDIIANIVDYQFEEMYDHVLAFEVFEHIPYDEFIHIFEKLSAICKKYLFMSIPENRKWLINLEMLLPFIGRKNISISKRKNKITTKNHFWEVNYKSHTLISIVNDIQNSGFLVKDHSRFQLLNYFVLESENYENS